MVEELKKIKAQTSIFPSSEGEDIEGEYMNPIPSPDLTLSLDSGLESKTEGWASPTQETNFPIETEDLAFEGKISQSVFTPSPSPLRVATNDHPVSEHSSEKRGDTAIS